MKKIIFLFAIITSYISAQEIGINSSVTTGNIEALKTYIPKNDENLYTGRNSVTLPLFTYEDQDFKIPISLQYSSGGYKTYQRMNCTGLGWNLNLGGYINRKINGIPDEKQTFFYNISQNNPKIYGFNYFSKKTNGNLLELIENNKGKVLFNDVSKEYFLGIESNDGNSYYVETTPDLFSFNFLSEKGNFMLNNNGNILIFDTSKPQGEYKIEILKFDPGDFPNDIVRIRITTGDGYKYIFEDKYVYYSNAIAYNKTNTVNNTHSTFYPLVEIQAPNGRSVKFEYFDKQPNTVSHFYYSKDADWNADGTYSGIGKGYLTSCQFEQIIKKITIDNICINFFCGDPRQEKVEIKPYSSSTQNYSYIKSSPLLNGFTVEKKDDNGIYSPIKIFNFKYSFGVNTDYITCREIPLLNEVELSDKESYKMQYYNEEKAFPPLTYGRDFWGYWNNSNIINDLPVTTTNIGTNVEIETSNNYLPNFESALQGMLKCIYYPTGGFTKYYYEQHIYSERLVKDYRNEAENRSYLEYVGNNIAGGVRIERIANYSSEFDSTYVDYLYYANPKLSSISSGVLLHTPRFNKEINYTYNNVNVHLKRISWLNDITSSDDNIDVAYSRVKKRYSDGSYSIYDFSDYKMFPDLHHNTDITINKFVLSSTDMEWANNFFADDESRHRIRGKLLSISDYNENGDKVHSIEYNYDFDKFNSDLTEEEISNNPSILETEFNIFTFKEALSYFYLQKYNTRSCPIVSINDTKWSSYPNTNTINVLRSYSYNNIGEVVLKKITQSDGKVINNEIKYPYDLRSNNGVQNKYDHMFDNGFRNYPVKTTTSVQNIGVTSYSFNNYQNFGDLINVKYYLDEIKSANFKTPLINGSSEYLDTFLKNEKRYIYNNMGRVLEETNLKDNVKIAYLWGYNLQFPICVIKNASYSQVEAILNPASISNLNSSTPSDAMIQSVGQSLRNDLPSALVTTYTYKPLIGISTMTDPRGVTSTYNYDEYYRLQNVKDKNSNLLQSYEYNYKP